MISYDVRRVAAFGDHSSRRLFKSTLKLAVRLFLDSLGILELFDELHLKFLHLHDLFFLLLTHIVFVADARFDGFLGLLGTALAIFFLFHSSQSLLLVYNLVLHAVLLFVFEAIEFLFLFILRRRKLRLLGFFASRLENCVLHFPFFVFTLLSQRVVHWSCLTLIVILGLVVVYFFLNTIFVAFFERKNFICAFFGVINLLPGLLLFLFEQSDTVRK